MAKYDMICENCGEVEIEHPMSEDHPEIHECGGKLSRYFGGLSAQPVSFKPSRGGGVDDWASQRVEIQHPTSEEANIPYR
jgi:hypothetical protein